MENLESGIKKSDFEEWCVVKILEYHELEGLSRYLLKNGFTSIKLIKEHFSKGNTFNTVIIEYMENRGLRTNLEDIEKYNEDLGKVFLNVKEAKFNNSELNVYLLPYPEAARENWTMARKHPAGKKVKIIDSAINKDNKKTNKYYVLYDEGRIEVPIADKFSPGYATKFTYEDAHDFIGGWVDTSHIDWSGVGKFIDNKGIYTGELDDDEPDEPGEDEAEEVVDEYDEDEDDEGDEEVVDDTKKWNNDGNIDVNDLPTTSYTTLPPNSILHNKRGRAPS